jgi:hypothetical protein
MHRPAPAPQGPIACTLHANDMAGRLEEFRHVVFQHLRELRRPEPARLRLVLDGGADPGAVADLLTREQACCAFLAFGLTPAGGRLLADLQVPAEAAPVLDGIAALAGPPTPELAR